MIKLTLKLFARIYSYIYYKKDRFRLKKLMSNGLAIGKNVYIMEDVQFDQVYPYLIEICDNCRISKDVRILAHDATTFRDLGITKLAKVKILEGTFIGERAIILPGVTIGPDALISAGAVVNRDIGEDMMAAGNPARPYGKFSDLLEKSRDLAKTSVVFNKHDLEEGNASAKDIQDAIFDGNIAFMRGVPEKDPYYINTNYDEMIKNSENNFKKMGIKTK